VKTWTSITRIALGLLPLGVSASAMLYYARHDAPALPYLDPPRAEFVAAPGMLVPAREIKILATGESRIVRIEVQPGQLVSRGQPLAVIESDSQKEAVPAPANQLERELADARTALQAKDSRLRTEEAALAIARAEFALSEERWRKAGELNGSGLIARLEFDAERKEFERARAALDEALEIVRDAKEARGKTALTIAELESRMIKPPTRAKGGETAETRTLRSPVDGIVGEIFVAAGEIFAAPEQGVPPPVVMTVLDPSRLNVWVLFSGPELGSIFPDYGVSVELGGEPLDSARGRVISASPESDGVREMLIEIDAWQSAWKAGQLCSVKFLTAPIAGPVDEFTAAPDEIAGAE
jgi:multidrug resistance efflux pump